VGLAPGKGAVVDAQFVDQSGRVPPTLRERRTLWPLFLVQRQPMRVHCSRGHRQSGRAGGTVMHSVQGIAKE
jgi:hypothetical protein